jgi:acyl-CoA reductase-like NAD-dependent aldehyde dehydrogenase
MFMLIGGRQRSSSTEKVIEIRDPADNLIIDSVPEASREDVREAVS